MRTLYQLVATGSGLFFSSSTMKISSRTVFVSRELAVKYIPEFTRLCTTEDFSVGTGALTSIDPKTCRVRVLELELSDEMETTMNEAQT